ncbi:hypothetical protein ACFUTX_16465, partial [Microbacterium sp. NPDC057407]
MTTPRVYATVTGPTATFTTPDGHTEPLTVAPDEDIRQAIVARTAEEARRTGEPVELVTAGDRGAHRLLITLTGDITEAPDADTFAPTESDDSAAPEETLRRDIRSTEPAPEVSGEEELRGEVSSRTSFITPHIGSETATAGWRGALARLGIAIKPSAAEVARRDREQVVSRQWAGCRTIAVVNGKGGVGKTMTTAMLAAVYARFGGGNVLAWDNNDTRGTLGWRTEQGLYDTTVRDLLPAADGLLGPAAGVSDISRFV